MCKKAGGTGEMSFRVKICLWVGIGLLILALIAYFIGIPFFMATIGKRIWPDIDTKDAISILDGVATFVGVTGTGASIASIFMTLSDKRRYKEEKDQIDLIKNTLDDVGDTLNDVDSTLKNVQKTANDISTENKELLFKLLEKDRDKKANPTLKDIFTSFIRDNLNAFNDGPAGED